MTSDEPQPIASVATATAVAPTPTPDAPPPDAWGMTIERTRQAELLRLLQKNAHLRANNGPRADYGPFARQRLTGADVYWLAVYTLACGDALRNPDHPTTIAAALSSVEDTAPGDSAIVAEAKSFVARMQGAVTRLAEAANNPLLRTSLNFDKLNLANAILGGARLHNAVLGGVHGESALLGAADLGAAYLGGAYLTDAYMDHAQLSNAILRRAEMSRVSLRSAKLIKADLGQATLNDAIMRRADLHEAQLVGAKVRKVDLREGALQQANFIEADLTDAYLYEAHLEGAFFTRANMQGCDLRRTTLDGETRLNNARLNKASLEQATLGDANLAVVRWSPGIIPAEGGKPADKDGDKVLGVKVLGDEIEAKESCKRVYKYDRTGRDRKADGDKKNKHERADDYRAAARAYRLLSVALSDQGLTREATRFQYRAEVMGRKANYHDGDRLHRLRWFGSYVLDFFAGYGIHQLWRLLATYLGAIALFTAIYWSIGHFWGPSLTLLNAVILSFSSFHGRGIGIAQSATVSDAMRIVAIIEAIVGVLVEALLVAALVKRVTGD